MAEDEYQRWFNHLGVIYGQQEATLLEYVSNFTEDQTIQCLRDAKAIPYMGNLFEHILYDCLDWKSLRKMVENSTFYRPTLGS